MNQIKEVGVATDILTLFCAPHVPNKNEEIIQWIEQCSGNIVRAMIVRLKIVQDQALEQAYKKNVKFFLDLLEPVVSEEKIKIDLEKEINRRMSEYYNEPGWTSVEHLSQEDYQHFLPFYIAENYPYPTRYIDSSSILIKLEFRVMFYLNSTTSQLGTFSEEIYSLRFLLNELIEMIDSRELWSVKIIQIIHLWKQLMEFGRIPLASDKEVKAGKKCTNSGKTSGKKEKEKCKKNWKKWQNAVEEYVKKNPNNSKSDAARAIGKKFGVNSETIKRRCEKQLAPLNKRKRKSNI